MTANKLDDAQWRRLSALFDEAAELPGAEQRRFIEALRASEPHLADRLARMLGELPADSTLGTAPQIGPAIAGFEAQLASALAEPAAAPAGTAPGDRFGAWRLVSQLGEGGMGEVWLAARADGLYDSTAAIKLLREDITGPGLAARFARERALLGRLTHPGIARLLDAGEQDGRAFLVLEHVQGQTLSEHVRTHRLGLDARVRLLLGVARAVEHAHAQLIVHRDLKPSNVMVEDGTQGAEGPPRGDLIPPGGGRDEARPWGRTPTAKLLDFGIAGLLDDQGAHTDGQLTMLAGRRLTPAYAAPEQILGSAVGVAADIYSLGVMLYELASGKLPFGGRGGTRTQLEHEVLHTEAKRITRTLTSKRRAAPSLRAPLGGWAGRSTALGAPEGTGGGESTNTGPGEPPDARRAAGDLEAVAAKAMRKNPAERYASVGALIDDLQNWLDQRPVSVRAEDWRHRLRLWARRNTALAVGGVLVFATLSAGLGVSLWQRREAQAAAKQSEAVTQFLTELLGSANPDKHGGRIPNVFELLEKSRAELQSRFAGDRLTYARVLDVMVTTYSDMNRHDIAIPLAGELIKVNRELWGDDDLRTIGASLRLASIFTTLGMPLEVITIGEPQLETVRQRFGDRSEEYENLLYQLIVAYANAGRFEDAERIRERAWPLVQQLFKPADFEYPFFHTYVFQLRVAQGRLLDAEQEILATVPSWATAPKHRARFVTRERQHLWNIQARLGRPEATPEAARDIIATMDALLGPGNSSAFKMRLDLARHLLDIGDFAGAVQMHEQAAASLRAAAADHPVLRLPRESAALLARALAQPQARASLLPAGRQLARELQTGRGITGPAWVEAASAVVRLGLLLSDLDLAEQALAPLRDLEAHPWLRAHAQTRSRIEQLAAEVARARGRVGDSLGGLRARIALLDSLPQPQGLPHWKAQLDLCLSLALAKDASLPQALERADALRPAWLGPHPLDELRRQLDGPGKPTGVWNGQF